MSTDRGIEVIFLAIAAAPLPAGAVVLLVARSRTAERSVNPRSPSAE
jgi:hypothetical protein